jgi:hypothetical protein
MTAPGGPAVLYLANPTRTARASMTSGYLACITTPAQGNHLPPGCMIGADNGKFGKGWPGAAAWFAWLTAEIARYGADRFLFAVAPDVPMDAAATLAESRPWLARIAALGVKPAFAAQDGSEQPGMIPWAEIGVLFLGGSTDWKLGPAARALTAQARARSIPVHMGRVNSRRRLRYAAAIGCASVDGTFLAFAPDVNLPKLLRWLDELGNGQQALFGPEQAAA